jgi:hypothetical protein
MIGLQSGMNKDDAGCLGWCDGRDNDILIVYHVMRQPKISKDALFPI